MEAILTNEVFITTVLSIIGIILGGIKSTQWWQKLSKDRHASLQSKLMLIAMQAVSSTYNEKVRALKDVDEFDEQAKGNARDLAWEKMLMLGKEHNIDVEKLVGGRLGADTYIETAVKHSKDLGR